MGTLIDIVCELDAQGRLISASKSFINSVGVPLEHLLGRLLQDIDRSAANIKAMQTFVDKVGATISWQPSLSIWSGEVSLMDASGTARVHRRSVLPIFSTSGQLEKYICVDFDITSLNTFEQTRIDQLYQQSIVSTFRHQSFEEHDLMRLMHKALEWMCIGLSSSQAALLIRHDAMAKPLIQAGLGWKPGWVGNPAICLSESKHGDGQLTLPDEMLLAHDVHSLLTAPSPAGSKQTFTLAVASTKCRLFSESDKEFLCSLAHVLSATLERHYSYEKLAQRARFDSLTGLPNRRLLFERLELAFAIARSQGSHVALLFLNLDRFKLVNNTLGHEAGDHLLVQVAHRVSASLRLGDTVARLAGDEFVVILPGLNERTDVELVGRKVLSELINPFDLNGHKIIVTVSIGAAIYPDHGIDTTSLLRCADLAMCFAKNTGFNDFRFYSAEMNASQVDRLDIFNLLHVAMERQEFSLVYQPRIDLATRRIKGLEALLRWTHPKRGPISPADFVPILEDTGLIIGVGKWVLREVAHQVMRWQAAGLDVPSVSINLSARQLASPEFDVHVRALLEETGIEPTLLELELTESLLMNEPERMLATLEHFRAYGLRLAIDDFGTGYSSLAYLRHFPLDVLKLDRAFVRDLATSTADVAIVLAIINMAHTLKLKVVAEGVETAEQLEILVKAGCDEIQGYYFSCPVLAHEIEHMLRENMVMN